ncbi:uncharacterized protein LOC135491048 [Lineus longissimus]|uniref:uncharacterized protein LOC135491048 n=1 Tax=Lineus longissimus TaxID=88925 RepID=UPI00315CA3C0
MADRIKASRAAHRGQATKTITAIDKILVTLKAMDRAMITPEDLDELHAKLQILETKRKTIKKLDAELLLQTEDDHVADVIVKYDDYNSELEGKAATFKRIEQRLSDHLTLKPAPEPQPPVPPSPTAPTFAPRTKNVQLPKLTLPTFSGDILQWQTFNDVFAAAIHNNTNLDNVQKLQYLRAQLSGEAADIIAGLSSTDANYAHAMELLRKRYGEKHKVISALMRAFWELPRPSEDIRGLRTFVDKIETYVRGLQSLNKTEDSYGDLLVPMLLDKIPPNTRKQLTRSNETADFTLRSLREALAKEIEAMDVAETNDTMHTLNESMATASFFTRDSNSQFKQRRPKPQATGYAGRGARESKCVFCKQSHRSLDCVVVTNIDKRADIVKRDQLCWNCLGPHQVRNCTSKYKCKHCSQKHHSTLCKEKPDGPNLPAANNSETKGLSCVLPPDDTAVNHINQISAVLLKTAVADISSTISKHKTSVALLFDDGSQKSFITAEAATKLGFQLNETLDTEMVNISTLGANSTGMKRLNAVTVAVHTTCGSTVHIRALVVPKITTPLRNYIDERIADLPHLRGLQLAHPVNTANPFEISVLVGADYYYSIVGYRIVRGKGPTAISSRLGYLLCGHTHHRTTVKDTNTLCGHVALETSKLEQFWDLENIGITDNPKEKEMTFDSYTETHLSMRDNHYTAKLPWREDHPPLPTNFAVCNARTRNMVRRLKPEIRETYDRIIKDQLFRDFVELVPDDNVKTGHYLPHHPVAKDSVTTPIRIVYDCSCKTGANPSLNDCLEDWATTSE